MVSLPVSDAYSFSYIFPTYTRIVVTSILIPCIENYCTKEYRILNFVFEIIESQLDKKSEDEKLSIVPKILHTHTHIYIYIYILTYTRNDRLDKYNKIG